MKGSKSILPPSLMGGLMPQEEMLEVARKKSMLFIGIPKECSLQENRVALVPEAVALLCNNDHRVVVERGAGKSANFQDNDYSEAGAEIVESVKEVYKADIVMKVEPLTSEEIKLVERKQTVFSALQMTVHPKDYIKNLISKRTVTDKDVTSQFSDKIFVPEEVVKKSSNSFFNIFIEKLSKSARSIL